MSRRKGCRDDGERGGGAIEFLAVLPVFLLVALMGLQFVMTTGAYTAAEHAARVGSRAAGLGADPVAAARATLPGGLAGGASISAGGSAVRVELDVPIVYPDLGSFSIAARADLPGPE